LSWDDNASALFEIKHLPSLFVRRDAFVYDVGGSVAL
jgi:hypothetical protein